MDNGGQQFTRRPKGLTAAHTNLITLLAHIAVDEYWAEQDQQETASTTHEKEEGAHDGTTR